ncbi:hypothetical protein EMPS_05084 [Entomortierella parvispora]|uniref:Uncharacterized protein n=1 Tax=Entomortierella parvispora TaxID=205924 RepID=A0A9P3H9M5_9FUNG|nr:hypothetical protein EMPS_05084 [Entomortierella parvispora]
MWEVIDSCESLQSLMITRAQITLTSWSACWCIYSRLRTLQLQEVDFWLPNGENDNITLSMCLLAQEEDNGGTPICSPIIELGLKDIRLPVEDQLAFLKVSPHLEAFSWTPRQRDRALIGDTLMEQAQHCPKLVHLDLDIENDALVSFLNHKVATIATHRPPEELKVVKMTEPIWGIVQVHFASSLRSLDLSSYHVEGKMILSMLTSLPNLESFSGKTICGKDVFHRQEIAVEPWVCTGLVHLSLGCAIDGEFSYGERCVAQAEIIERIGSLTRLKTLRMFGHDGINMPGCYRYLNFGLDSGLDYLKNLKQLKSIDFSHTPQQLGEREIRWMLSNWPRLEILTGTLHSRTMLNESLRTLLARHGVLQDNRSGRRAYKC